MRKQNTAEKNLKSLVRPTNFCAMATASPDKSIAGIYQPRYFGIVRPRTYPANIHKRITIVAKATTIRLIPMPCTLIIFWNLEVTVTSPVRPIRQQPKVGPFLLPADSQQQYPLSNTKPLRRPPNPLTQAESKD